MDIFRVQELYAAVPEFVGEEEGDEKIPQEPIFSWARSVDSRLQAGKLKTKLVIVACHGAASVAADVRFGALNMNRVATLLLPEIPLRITSSPSATDNDCGVYSLTADLCTLLVICRYPVLVERANAWRRALFAHIDAQRVVVLSVMSADSYRTLSEVATRAPYMRCLLTTEHPDVSLCPTLEVPNMASGIPAAILSHCEVKGVAAAVYLSYQDNQGPSLETIAAWEPVFAHLEAPAATPAVSKEMHRRLSLQAPNLNPLFM